ncbi:MAG: GNAT family N-acetyltransferase [Anaerolineae bacterium]|nr:GNAT family N-acetyltransferase [Anaerolineae bacterium]
MPRIDVDLNPSQADWDEVNRGLTAFNAPFTGADNYQRLAIFIRDEQDQIIGGLTGETYWDWLYVENLWLHESIRGQDYGTQIMTLAEAEARKRGCIRVHLDTLGFQALGFYQKLGYSLYGQIDNFINGYARYYLKKELKEVTSKDNPIRKKTER